MTTRLRAALNQLEAFSMECLRAKAHPEEQFKFLGDELLEAIAVVVEAHRPPEPGELVVSWRADQAVLQAKAPFGALIIRQGENERAIQTQTWIRHRDRKDVVAIVAGLGTTLIRRGFAREMHGGLDLAWTTVNQLRGYEHDEPEQGPETD